VDCCSEKYPEKNRSRLFFLIFEIKPKISKNSEKAIFRPAFLVFEKKTNTLKKPDFHNLVSKKPNWQP